MKSSTTKTELTLAEMISQVLHHPELPPPLWGAIADGLDELFNEHVDQSEILNAQKQPPYINWLINGYHANSPKEVTE